jgi:Spy/CpxP family protein refolding chaperone
MNKLLRAAACALVACLAPAAFAQAPAPAAPAGPAVTPGGPDVATLAKMRERVRADRRAVVAQNLPLTDAEAKAFWPAYDKCRSEMDAAHRKANRAITDFVSAEARMTDASAKQIMNDALAAEVDEARARKSCFDRVAKALPAKKAARYIQIETKIDSLSRFDAAVVIPLVH